MGILFSVCAFVVTFLRTRQGLAKGLESLLAVGYAYGIFRANFPDGWSHFAFDAALLGLYAAHFTRRHGPRAAALGKPVVFWLKALFFIPLLYFLIPLQHPLVQLVGLRAALFFLPVILLGARLEVADLGRLARFIGILNIMALGFATAEFFLGVDKFYPFNEVTELIYRSSDVGENRAFRIPATFTSAHAFGGAMLVTLPLLLGHWNSLAGSVRERTFLLVAAVASVIGIFACGARQPVVTLVALLGATLLSSSLGLRRKISLAAAGLLVVGVISTSERFRRFETLQDSEYVEERVRGSVSLGLLDVIFEYPLGAGLARGGTSIPFFLADLAEPSIGLENELSRIALEEGIFGLAIWIAFIIWAVSRPLTWVPEPWRLGIRMARFMVVLLWATSLIGTGTLASIPGSFFLLLYMGLLTSSQGRTARLSTAPLAPAAAFANR